MRRNVEMPLKTNGWGEWTPRAADVKVVSFELISRGRDEGETDETGTLNVYFDTASWDVQEHDVIYTDPEFLRGVQGALETVGIRGQVGYNEHGMQGVDYVSFDVWGNFDGFFVETPKVFILTDYKVERTVLAAEPPVSPEALPPVTNLRQVNPLAAFELDQVQDALNGLRRVLAEGGEAQRRAFFEMRDRAEAAEARVRALEAHLASNGVVRLVEVAPRG